MVSKGCNLTETLQFLTSIDKIVALFVRSAAGILIRTQTVLTVAHVDLTRLKLILSHLLTRRFR